MNKSIKYKSNLQLETNIVLNDSG